LALLARAQGLFAVDPSCTRPARASGQTCVPLFALTWHQLDASDKFDPGAKAGFTRGEYRFKVPLIIVPPAGKVAGLTSAVVVAKVA
jgi:hypothetical protein